MHLLRAGLLVGAVAILGGCVSLPPAVMVASYMASGVSLAASGKTLTDHAISTVAQRDCATFNLIRGESFCADEIGAVADGSLADPEGAAVYPSAGPDQNPIPTDDAGAVQLAQSYLVHFGYEPGPVDGAGGIKTRAALRAYLLDQGFEPEGELTPHVLRMMGRQLAAGATVGPPYPDAEADGAALAIDPDDPSVIRLAQAQLAYFGYRTGRIDGVLGQQTIAAIAAFQRETGRVPTGRLTPDLMLTLGDAVAGEAERNVAQAPRPLADPAPPEAG